METPKFNSPEKEDVVIKKVFSDIETPDGNDAEAIKIKLHEGLPKAAAFFDIDGTLGNFKDMHGGAIKRLYPDCDPEEVVQEFYRGISLGTTYRVHDRMIKIYGDGIEEFKDTEKYMDWFSKHQSEVDEAGSVHDKAAEYSMNHSKMSAKIAEEMYEKDPSIFEKTKLLPVFRLAEIYKKMGIPMTIMTANDAPFAKSICKCLGFSESFLTSVNQGDFEGSGKDVAIENLIKKLKEKGIPIPPKLIVVGDSLNGDIGSGAKFMKNHPEFEVEGVLVGNEGVEEMKESVKNNSQLEGIKVEVLDPNLVEENSIGQPNLSAYRKKYATKS